MIGVGHPFSKPFQDLVDSLVGSLQLGVEQPATLEILFRRDTRAYPLQGPGPVSGLADQITGFVAGKPAIFNRGQHYVYAVGQLVWQALPSPVDPDVAAGWFPDDNSRLTVGYFFRDLPSGITDFNAGSVAGTVVRAVSRELKLLYEQMDQAYQRAFIDYAQGAALDNVVALLGISRNLALPAQGGVTFSLKTAPRTDVPIAVGTRVADARGRLFRVAAPGVIRAVPLDEPSTASGVVVRTAEEIGALVHVRVSGATTNLATVPTRAGKPFGDDESTITLAAAPPSSSVIVTYQPKSVTVPVIAVDTGPEGNLGSGSLTVMPTPPRGVDGGVVNKKPLTGGEAAEADDQLRERAKHALERAGNATLNAIRFAVLNVDGVDSVEVRDFSVDQTIPLGEVRVRISTGKPDVLPRVDDEVDKTRAAGIKARVTQVSIVTLSGTIYVIPDLTGSGRDAYARYKTAVVSALKALGIGEPVSPRKIASLVFQIAGLADIGEVQLDYVRGSDAARPVEKDPFVIDAAEQARPDEGAIHVVPVQALAASSATLAGDGTLSVTIRALSVSDDDRTSIRFRNLQLAVLATVRAKPAATPNQPLQQVAQVTGTATFTATDHASPLFPKVTISNLASLDAATIELGVQAAAYPGILPGTTKLAT
jgi:uncharacterized phage protein gp47/JayE